MGKRYAWNLVRRGHWILAGGRRRRCAAPPQALPKARRRGCGGLTARCRRASHLDGRWPGHGVSGDIERYAAGGAGVQCGYCQHGNSSLPNPAPLAPLRTQNADLAARLGSLTTTHEALKADYAALRHQLFGRRSEKHIPFEPGAAPVSVEEISYRRRKKQRGDAALETGLRFDESVSVTTIEVWGPAVEAIPKEERERIGEKVTHRPAQRPASYEVLRYVRPLVKRRETGELVTARAPSNVLERTAADVSVLAGMLADKFSYHLPPSAEPTET